MDSTNNLYTDLSRTNSSTSVDTNATAPNLPGPGRNVGNLYAGLGGRLETVLNSYAARFGRRQPEAAQDGGRQCLRRNRDDFFVWRRSHDPPKRANGLRELTPSIHGIAS
ncbi:hypothetical protein SCHPADRAFT_886161 [Schizopora paradoxa]|uniref:Uncharacterized protein n=1 Tax=Schizopora paradoxa TaxID=27342 RepID=A0A0H2S2B4_9AGAM|nr:hypothetical protein SCHPADRAFT_886161 [Schizopora paradoxa]